MTGCGGTMATGRVALESKAIQLVSQLDSRSRVTVRAAQENDAAVFLVSTPSTPYTEGFPLYPGEAYTFDGDAARAAIYGVGPYSGDRIVWYMTEGA